ncbi:efflux RND transporter periplasmic adaptor subunit [Bacillus sp. FSL M8-0052]|uniref:HlyD family secretion protein n=1 Tax=Bacillus glycinifermentans TaxID=1664069 RepID=A0AAJ3YXF1_9BACI|nr:MULTISPECIES: efflux RND transporter periplasmic adaptor subunit [Bacillus]KKB71607.1 transporter [Bacillus sp. TH008]MBU8788488.1 efflux RND transporter periplasmic adaptor subunit [Bacillus glycinifermentans]MDU0071803.1 efflux RND transporter periplasmic adaptor subunit [Bacillus sp. IG6]MED8019964.1 efflux RND transporter periplasmic adaptor subunit [Bacillus glycinifermentans]NUJ17962.1 HlyD family secretion protein [Bacillus glycinifermentans]
MSKGRLILTNIIGLIVVLAIIAGGAYYYYNSVSYVTTDEAHVAGDMAEITAPASGKLSGWDIDEGTKVTKDEKTAKIKGEQTVDVKSIMDGTIVKNEAKDGQMVQAGQTLAQTIDMDHLYITANIKETDVKDIEKGDKVDIVVDGDPGATFEGNVEEIGYATNSTFDLLPQQNTSGNYTKVTQKVPVKISIKNPSDKVLPGMNASVKISK